VTGGAGGSPRTETQCGRLARGARMREDWLIHRALRVKMDAMSHFQRPWAGARSPKDFQAPMRAAGCHPPHRRALRRCGTAGLRAQSGNPRSSAQALAQRWKAFQDVPGLGVKLVFFHRNALCAKAPPFRTLRMLALTPSFIPPTRPSRRRCNPRVPRAGSLSLSR
jgi:hypothetical protein